MLVDTHPVEAKSVGVLQFVYKITVVLLTKLRIEVFIGQVYPGASMVRFKVSR